MLTKRAQPRLRSSFSSLSTGSGSGSDAGEEDYITRGLLVEVSRGGLHSVLALNIPYSAPYQEPYIGSVDITRGLLVEVSQGGDHSEALRHNVRLCAFVHDPIIPAAVVPKCVIGSCPRGITYETFERGLVYCTGPLTQPGLAGARQRARARGRPGARRQG